jgi:hypothetical protein
MAPRKRKQDELEARGDAGLDRAHQPGGPSAPPPSKTRRESPGPPAPAMPSPPAVDALLACALCRGPLCQPTTLRCGHAVCALHVAGAGDSPRPDSPLPPRCPLRDCDSTSLSSRAAPRIPSSSRVRYNPAPDGAAPPPLVLPESVPAPRLDVTLNKLIGLVARAKQSLEDAPPADSSEPESDSSSSAHDRRPNKRRRRHISPPPQDDDGADDLLSHLRRQAIRQRALSPDEPVLPSLPSSHLDAPLPRPKDAVLAGFRKDLLVELTCEICFVLLYQPITTPCQHVRPVPSLTLPI